ncbi:lamin tail domain-containing protein, partial [bacterium]|nr:lamin tail domain-containing protein [bacterium]
MSFAERTRRLQTNRGLPKFGVPVRRALALLVFFWSLVVSWAAASAETVRINEFMAINDETIIDDDDDRSDWIEIHNPTNAAVNLTGWHLTDDFADPTKWPFPNIILPPNSYMVVFASGKDRRTLGAPLHTNFALRGDGEYLALVDSDGNRVAEFLPTYPKQKPDISYGLGREVDDEITLLDTGAPAHALIPADDSLGLSWTEVGFDHASWLSGTTGVGYDYGELIGLDVRAMRYVNETVYIRIPFQIEELPEFDSLTLRLQYEDGMIAYLNGQEISRENDPDWPTWNSGALSNRPDSEATSLVEIDISSALDLLRVGKNVLAFHGLNYLVTSSDLLVRPQLVGAIRPEGSEVWGYSLSPTPGAPNGPTVPAVVDKARFSVPSGTFVNSFTLNLMLPDDAAEGAVIRYTMDGGVPNESSPLYTGPRTIATTTLVRAKVFEPGGGESPTVSETYIGLESDVVNFSSNLPLVILENFAGGWMPQSSFQPAFLAIFEPGSGRSSLIAAPALSTRAGIKIRGSSTAGRPKPSLNVEAWDEADEDKNISPLGMPAESDWVLWGPYNFDLALMRNPLIFELSNQVGRYAVRTRFVEVFLNTGGGRLTYADYWGVYALMEKISRDEDRVDVERLFPEHGCEPGVTGGYMLKIDRADPGDSGFGAAGQTLRYVYPKEIDIERPERDAQEQYIRSFFNSFGSALNGPNYTDPYVGYAKYVDVDSWIDHHLLNVVAFNVDAFRLSGYMFKKRGRKLEMGPIWDFDRAMGSTDGRDINPWVWRAQSGDRGTDFFNYPWWGRMFGDIDFFQRYIDRWQELRKAQFSAENIHSVVDSMANELREAQVRDLQRWGQTPRFGGYQGEIDHLKQWFADRITFMDSQFVAPPVFSSDGGQIGSGFTLTMTRPAGTIYYTLDGSDPRSPGGEVSTRALAYDGPITLVDTTNVTARALNLSHVSLIGPDNPPLTSYWSGLTKARFSIHQLAGAGNLVITEINYHPLDPMNKELSVDPDFVKDDFEFIELKNIGATIIDLVGVEFTNGIAFSFTDTGVTTLRPGKLVLVVKNRAAFEARYGALNNIAGEYTGNLDNGGEALRLVDTRGNTILNFDYQDDWCPITDGLGFSLVILNENAAASSWGDKASWRTSTNPGGSPEGDDPAPSAIPPILVNEALTNSDFPEVDFIELHNPTGNDVNIGGWFLTDDASTPHKFRVPDGEVIFAGMYLVFNENDFNAPDAPNENRFSLSSKGEDVYLFSADAVGKLTGYFHGFAFGAAETGMTFGRHVVSTGEEHFVAQVAPTLSDVNAGPKVGPVVINEIMYNPSPIGGENNTRDEYLELRNISSEPVPLFDTDEPENTWRLEGGVDYTFPPDVTLLPGEYLLMVSFDPQTDPVTLVAFLDVYDLDMSVRMFGPCSGKLENAGERIGLFEPGAPESPDPGPVPYILVDQVDYSNSDPWPTGADATGNSLQRVFSGEYGNDPVNWKVAPPTPGLDNAGSSAEDADGDGMPDEWEQIIVDFDPEDEVDNILKVKGDEDFDGDGVSNFSEY